MVAMLQDCSLSLGSKARYQQSMSSEGGEQQLMDRMSCYCLGAKFWYSSKHLLLFVCFRWSPCITPTGTETYH